MLWVAAAYGSALLAIHVVVSNAGKLPPDVKAKLGADAGSMLTRAWAPLTSQWLHNSWGHLSYNLIVLAASMPFALQTYGWRTLPVMIVASVAATALANLILLVPAPAVPSAHAMLDARLVGASVAIFAGVGLAIVGLGLPKCWFLAVACYEITLMALAITGPFVWLYHLAGLGTGIAAGTWLRE